jgi:hypothetical protein
MTCMQYTIRGIPASLDLGLRQYAKAKAKSLNQILIETLSAGLGIFRQTPKNEELRALARTWVDDPVADKAFAEMRTIDEDLWK